MTSGMEPLLVGLAPILAGFFVAVRQVMADGLDGDVLLVGGLGASLAYLLWIPIAMLLQWSIRVHFCSGLVANACG